MMRTSIAATVVLITLATFGRAQNDPARLGVGDTIAVAAAKSAPPSFAFVHDLDKSQNLVYVLTIEQVPREETRTVTETVEQNGKAFQVTRLIKVRVYVPVSRVTKWDASKGTAINGAGKKLSREDLFQQLKAGDTILTYSGDLDQAFLKPLKENVVLLQMPPPVAPMNTPEPISGPKK